MVVSYGKKDGWDVGTAKMRNRYQAEKLTGGLYTYVGIYGHDVCVYCGELADTIDHLLCVSYVANLLSINVHAVDRVRSSCIKVPACVECNSLLGDFIAYTLEDKRAELKKRLRVKYKRLLNGKPWTQDEIDDGHKGRLRQYLQGNKNKRGRVELRLQFPADYTILVVNNIPEVELLPVQRIITEPLTSQAILDRLRKLRERHTKLTEE